MAIEMFINLKKYVLLKKHGFPIANLSLRTESEK